MILMELSKTDYSAKSTEIKGKISSITGLGTKDTLNTVETDIPNVIDLVKKTDYDPKISDIETKYFTTLICSKFCRWNT